MSKNTPSNFIFKGRYTLRGINDVWYVYDRKTMSIVKDSPRWHTFTKAEKGLMKYKLKMKKLM